MRYTNFLEGTDATLSYTYTPDSFDQTLVLYKNIPSHAELGLQGDPSKIRLFVATEFVDPPAPIRAAGTIDLRDLNQQFGVTGPDEIADETLFWGSMRMGKGRSFILGDSSAEVPSAKSFVNISGHWILIESTPLVLLRAMLDSLPPGTLHAKAKGRGEVHARGSHSLTTEAGGGAAPKGIRFSTQSQLWRLPPWPRS